MEYIVLYNYGTGSTLFLIRAESRKILEDSVNHHCKIYSVPEARRVDVDDDDLRRLRSKAYDLNDLPEFLKAEILK